MRACAACVDFVTIAFDSVAVSISLALGPSLRND